MTTNGPRTPWESDTTAFGMIRECQVLVAVLRLQVYRRRYTTAPNEPGVNYPPGFQGTSIPVHGPTVAQLIEDRLEGRLEY